MIRIDSHTGLFILSLMTAALAMPPAGSSGQVSIGPGGFITVTPGGSLMIGTDLHIKSIDGASGALADQNAAGDISITGSITVDRYLSPDVWHNISSPVSNATSAVFSGTDLVFWYDETQIWNDWNFGWVWYTGPTGGPLMVFRGYDVFYDSVPYTVTFTPGGSGTLNTGSYNYNVTITDPTPNPIEIPSHMGWNLAGNPYPSPVDWLASAGWDKSDINDAKYIWDGLNDIYTIYIGGGSPIGINGGTRFIPSSQGFWVQAVQNGTIGIGNATRIGSMTGTPDYYKTIPPDYPLISLVASGNGRNDEVVIRFIQGTTNGFDVNFDASKLFSFAEEVPQLGIIAGKQTLALNSYDALRDHLTINLSFRCGIPGHYTINLSDRTSVDPQVRIFLKDDQASFLTELTVNPSYSFYHDPSYEKNRFRIFTGTSDYLPEDEGDLSPFHVYNVKNRIYIRSNNTEVLQGRIMLCNLTGQTIYDSGLKNLQNFSFAVQIPTGSYLLYIIDNQLYYSKKIVIIN